MPYPKAIDPIAIDKSESLNLDSRVSNLFSLSSRQDIQVLLNAIPSSFGLDHMHSEQVLGRNSDRHYVDVCS